MNSHLEKKGCTESLLPLKSLFQRLGALLLRGGSKTAPLGDGEAAFQRGLSSLLRLLLSQLCSVAMNGSRCSAADSPVGGVSSVDGLPPLPRGLSGILNSSGGSWRDIEKVHSKRARIQADISRGGGDAPRSHGKPAGLDAALALLRKEMVGLRQLDMSLLCQLWSLHEAIQEYKGSSLLSEASLSADNGSSEEDEEDEDEEETAVLSQLPSSSSLSLPPPSCNSRDQWIKDSFHIP
ncbi:protein FAM89A [Plectropomus leopardus]|uniref:protein FAM89A n=1 Tax=Plectropomus leopardus TaxID=160734 RepID=UPI001C4B7DE0|nr:protein FAM89A [Plectropomus leopardus]